MAYIEKRGNNSYRLVVDVGFNSLGKRIRKTKTITCKNKSEAKKELAIFQTEIEAGAYISPQKMTFEYFIEEWKEKYARKQLSPSTYETYMIYISNRITPVFGHMKLDQINTLLILDFLDNLQNDGMREDGKSGKLSSATIQYYHRILKNIFTRAVEWKILKVNPVSGIKKPKVIVNKKAVYDESQVQILLEKLNKEELKWKMIVTLAITTGIRRGELLALEWEHVDFEQGKLMVQQSLSYTKNEGHIFKETKTKSSNRSISLPKPILDQLKKYRQLKIKEKLSIGDKWNGGNKSLIFSTWDGLPMHPSSVSSWWRKRLRLYNLPSITFHDLRHTSATLLINQGVHMKVISDRLGHSKISTTMDLYGHTLESADEKAAAQFNMYFEKQKNS
ncbi:site-specific integrase [Bacillus sp. AFS017336]|uniref:tyrosine-type recombinase/integrase n=1 Tax=Bacillus sp. AFS017336 TaxID=2033489 RepID=UPI000BF23324|nr:site-specific integrase [Bacillus sp. AFS017336]PEK99491.1 site-specific integrase [Bacillus sp. AFS017336]